MANDRDRIRVNFHLNANIVAQVDEYANELGVTRGQAVSVICSQFFMQRRVTSVSGDMVNLIRNGDLQSLIAKNEAGEFNV